MIMKIESSSEEIHLDAGMPVTDTPHEGYEVKTIALFLWNKF